jgi:hypothetical protein
MINKMRAFLGLCAVAFCSTAGAINISTEGLGTVSPDLTGKQLIGGTTYTLTAKPRAGYKFDRWISSDEFRSPKLSITLLNGLLYVKNGTNYYYIGGSDSTITASFVSKTIVPGTYVGISTEIVNMYSTFRISADGAFSAKVFFQGQWHPFSGKIAAGGSSAHSTLRLGNTKVGITVSVNSQGNAVYTHLESDPEDLDSPLNWIQAYLVVPSHDPRITTDYGGKYTITLPGADDDPSVPKGDGFIIASIDRAGRLHAKGKLADGTPFTQSVPLSTAQYSVEWPIFLMFKGGTATLAGSVYFSSLDGLVWGGVTWEKLPQTNDLIYPQGFRAYQNINGSRFLPPSFHGNFLLDIPELLISFDGGTLPIHFGADATLTSDNQIVVNNPTNQVAINIDTNNGHFTGSAIPPGESDSIKFEGAILQDGASYGGLVAYGSGFFLQDNLSGRVMIFIRPSPQAHNRTH